MRIRIVANNCEWGTWSEKIKQLHDWFLPKVDIDFSLFHTSFPSVPFIPFKNADVISGGDNVSGIDENWYNNNVLPLGIGYDMVMFVMNLSEWKGGNSRGWRTDSDEGPIELQVSADEKEIIIFPNFPALSGFFQVARHEVMHGLFMITGQPDTTHFYWNQGNLDLARDSINLQKNYAVGIVARAFLYLLNTIFKLQLTMSQITPEPPKIDPEKPKTNSEILFLTAKSCLGVDASPNDLVPDELGCAETVNAIYKKAFGSEIGGDVSTYRLYGTLKAHPLFQKADVASPGDIVISPTGYGGKNGMTHGHVGIMGEGGKIMSNESSNGKFEENYTLEGWRKYFAVKGGYPVLFFHRI